MPCPLPPDTIQWGYEDAAAARGWQGQGPVTKERGPEPAGVPGGRPPGWQGQGPVTKERGLEPAGVPGVAPRASRAQRTNMWLAAWFARFSSGPGTKPKTRVVAAPMATAAPVNRPGVTTLGPSGAGSLKNISTMTRT